MRIISLGHACQVAHQLRRLEVAKETLFYDWIVSTHDALMSTLHLELDGILFSERIEFDSRKVRLQDKASGLWFYGHDFPGAANKTGIATKDEVDAVREKYLRRSERTKQALSENDVTVIRHFYDLQLEKAQTEQLEIAAKLEQLYPGTNFLYLWISELPESDHTPHKGRMLHVPKGADWKGDDHAWDRVAERFMRQ
ncbi:DUF1796 family putative cysteine peptidase [Rhizobium sullae]|uniref:DUF1796 family putative cysteine peptidase n=1 Tax=Rhizobium sullae TaxID=50338 RepID=UPI000B35741E|nr:DUF1796 family putative cysteine peptidase [Rhizobium sullae]